MITKYRPLLAAPVLLLAACAGTNEIPAWGADLTAVTAGNKLLTFNHGTPGTLDSGMSIWGMPAGESIVGIDYRTSDGQLYGLGNKGHLYLLDVKKGMAKAKATLHGESFTALEGGAFGFSFGPGEKLRVVSDAGQNLSVDPDSGAVQVDASLDTAKVSAVAAAYTTVPNGPFPPTLYVLNSKSKDGEIASTLAPAGGKLLAVGALGSEIGKAGGFDVRGNESEGVAYAAAAAPDATSSKLYLVKLSAGSAKGLGTIGGGEKVVGLAIRTSLDN